MKIYIVSPVFPPEPIVSANTSADLAQGLAAREHSVMVITTFPNRPAGKIYTGYKRQFINRKKNGSFETLRCFSFFSVHSKLYSRFMENISFGIASSLVVMFLGKADVLYANTWPIFAQGLLTLACRLRGIPIVLSIQDIYPESLLSQKRVQQQDSLSTRLLRWLDAKTVGNAAALIVISRHFKTIYTQDRCVPAEKIHIIPNWVDENKLEVNLENNSIRKQHEIPEDAFLVVYGGNIGVAAGLAGVIQAFDRLCAYSKIYLLIAGSGSQLAECRQLARESANPRIIFHSPWLDSETSGVLSAADVCILPTLSNQSIVSVPSKLITYMLAARPVLSCVAEESDIADMLGSACCGWVIPPDNPQALAEKILSLSKFEPRERMIYGEQGRQYALEHMTRAANLPRLIDLIEKEGRLDPTQKTLNKLFHR